MKLLSLSSSLCAILCIKRNLPERSSPFRSPRYRGAHISPRPNEIRLIANELPSQVVPDNRRFLAKTLPNQYRTGARGQLGNTDRPGHKLAEAEAPFTLIAIVYVWCWKGETNFSCVVATTQLSPSLGLALHAPRSSFVGLLTSVLRLKNHESRDLWLDADRFPARWELLDS